MNASEENTGLRYFHLWFGWASLLLFLGMGLVLEMMHGFKMAWYLDVGMENRRLLFTLAHSHGALIGLIHLSFAAHVERMGSNRALQTASWCLSSATVLLPGGFFLGGLFLLGSDPGIGVFLTPIGGLLLVVGVGAALYASIR